MGRNRRAVEISENYDSKLFGVNHIRPDEMRYMAIAITVPRLGWTMEQGIFAGWLKQDGDAIRAGDPLFTLESDKATEEVEALDSGVLHIPPDGPQPGDTTRV